MLLMPLVASAQYQSFELYYIAHDRTTPISDLCDKLEEAYDYALRDTSSAVVFYLPNAKEPIVIKVNLEGDNSQEFPRLISELRSKSFHIIDVTTDLSTITEIMNENDFLNSDGSPYYSSMKFYWYVNQEFWLFQYNETLISSLYFQLDLDNYHKTGYVSTEIWHADGDGVEELIDKKEPFGAKNLSPNMAKEFILLHY